jgi:hypothetical protein
MRKRLIAAVALTAIAGSAHAEDRRTQMFDGITVTVHKTAGVAPSMP